MSGQCGKQQQAWGLEQDAQSSCLNISTEQRVKWKGQFLNSQSLAAGTYFLPQGHTSDVSTNTATNWEPAGQIYEPMGTFSFRVSHPLYQLLLSYKRYSSYSFSRSLVLLLLVRIHVKDVSFYL